MQNEDVEDDKKPLRIGSFAAHSARGLIRDQRTRRRAMFFMLIVAMLMVFAGVSFRQSALSPKEHPIWIILYWAACGWITFTALLLALFDVLMVRLQARTERRALQQKLKE
ncbi:MAG: hypothetical protein M3R59_08435 [Verrucomicrobiota bacterium]|nr:hypothetical protein [Verrucomicrobiota bacterium]